MARLPVPGQDTGTWGQILNEFLEVGHNADGTLKLPPSTETPDATNTVKGKIKLTGDIGGSADSPTVVSTSLINALPINQGGTGNNNRSDAINALLPDQSGQNGKILQSDGSNAIWVTPAATNLDDIYAMQWMEVGA